MTLFLTSVRIMLNFSACHRTSLHASTGIESKSGGFVPASGK